MPHYLLSGRLFERMCQHVHVCVAGAASVNSLTLIMCRSHLGKFPDTRMHSFVLLHSEVIVMRGVYAEPPCKYCYAVIEIESMAQEQRVCC